MVTSPFLSGFSSHDTNQYGPISDLAVNFVVGGSNLLKSTCARLAAAVAARIASVAVSLEWGGVAHPVVSAMCAQTTVNVVALRIRSNEYSVNFRLFSLKIFA